MTNCWRTLLCWLFGLSVRLPTRMLYLAHFVHAGTTRSAQVSLGIYTGPEIGRFVVVSRHGAALAATFVPLQGAPVSLRFVQFSTSPHP